MKVGKIKTYGSMIIAGQKFTQVYWLEMLNPENPEYKQGVNFLELETADIDGDMVQAAIKDEKIPQFRGLPVKLQPKLKEIDISKNIVEIPDKNPPPPTQQPETTESIDLVQPDTVTEVEQGPVKKKTGRPKR